MARQLKKRGLPFEFIDAVEGAALSAAQIEEIYDPGLSVKQVHRELVPAELGCYLSHCNVYRRMVEENLQEVLVLEDDTELDDSFVEIVMARHSFPADLELLLLAHHGAQKYFWWKQRIPGKRSLVRFVTPPMATMGYLVRRAGAEKILSSAFPVRAPIDHVTGGEVFTGTRLYGVDPPCVLENPLARSHSCIPGRDEQWEAHRVHGYAWRKYIFSARTFLINIHVRFWRKYIK
jgi:glycosyl transferase family 25